MIFTANDLRHLVIRDTLNYLNDWSMAAENLLLGTAAQESGLGGWHEGRRVGLYHITPAMLQWIRSSDEISTSVFLALSNA